MHGYTMLYLQKFLSQIVALLSSFETPPLQSSLEVTTLLTLIDSKFVEI